MDQPVFASIVDAAIADIREGKIVLVVDDADRENEGDFVMAAEKCTPEAVNFMVTHGRGIVCLPVAAWRLDELQIPQMVSTNGGRRHRVHGVDRLPARRHDGHQRARPRGHRARRSSIRAPGRRTSIGPATCSRSARRRAACSGAPATPRRPSTSRSSPGSSLRA